MGRERREREEKGRGKEGKEVYSSSTYL